MVSRLSISWFMQENKKKLVSIIDSFFHNDVSLFCQDWDDVIRSAENVSVFHLKSTVDYYAEYHGGINLSFVLYENKRPVAVFPLLIHENNQGLVISANGVDLIEPLFIVQIGRKIKKRLENLLVSMVCAFANELLISETRLVSMSYGGLSNWYLLWLEHAARIYVTHHLSIDLSVPYEVIKKTFRKSYKPLISKSLREWDISVVDTEASLVFDEFRQLHQEVSGRQTRSLRSWRMQQTQVEQGEAFLVTARDGLGTLVGAGLFTYTNNIGSYSVGAYMRELFDKPIGHGIQAKAIETLGLKGCRWYEIGQKQCVLDEVTPTEKELSISHFKEGFASDIFARPHLLVKMDE